MNEEQKLRYDRLCQFSIDSGDEQLPLHRRLTRENGWPLS